MGYNGMHMNMFNGSVYDVVRVFCNMYTFAVVWCTHHCLNIKDFDAGDNNAYYRIIAQFSK